MNLDRIITPYIIIMHSAHARLASRAYIDDGGLRTEESDCFVRPGDSCCTAKETKKATESAYLDQRMDSQPRSARSFSPAYARDTIARYIQLQQFFCGWTPQHLSSIPPRITYQDTVMKQAISPAERLAVTLRFLATGKCDLLRRAHKSFERVVYNYIYIACMHIIIHCCMSPPQVKRLRASSIYTESPPRLLVK